MTKKILQRTRFFFAVEGEGEQSLIRWVQELSDKNGLHIYLDCQVLSGGGYETMLARAIQFRKRKERQSVKNSVLLVDSDRDERGDDGWSLHQLKQTALKNNFKVCVQNPNLEGLLLRLMPGKERLKPHISSVHKLLLSAWPGYEKPADARSLSEKFSLQDLRRVAKVDKDFCEILKLIGLI